jgi:putative membrane protein
MLRFLLTGLAVLLTGYLLPGVHVEHYGYAVPGFDVDGFWWALAFSIILAIFNSFFSDVANDEKK